ncbi:MAG: hypothetical protein OXU20_01060 [Myxococcales bacterium]|nr:hypothetical protein [Myxococcales bacterium]
MSGNTRIGSSGSERPAGRFGTFGGVFTPSVLTILGVVMYLRLGWVVGQQGLGGSLVIVVVSHVISLATGLSVASIATNRTMGAGGAYFMISRSLGAPAGAAIGMPLFLGQALGVTFYIVGFTESLSGLPLFSWLREPLLGSLTGEKVVGTLVLSSLTVLSIKSAELAIKAQYIVMGVIGLSLVSFFSGHGSTPPDQIPWRNPQGAPFKEVFAVFFPAVTGIMAGVSMSGDLRDPRRSIPRGTLLAIGAGFLVYMAFPVWLSFNATTSEMTDNLRVVWSIASVPLLVDMGVWAATLSSALASVMTAPRTLQALAQDGHAPRLFGRGMGENGEPVAGLVLTFVLAETGIIFGNLDVIAPILTMFFLVTYGFTNLACGLERWAASPSFRPDFKVPASVSLCGAAACFYVMLIIDAIAMFGALVVCSGIFLLTQRRVLGTTYGDARHGIWAALVRSALHRLREARFHPLNWRPNLLILGGDPDKRAHLLRLGSAIVQERGIVSYAQLIPGSVQAQSEARRQLQRKVGERVYEAFPNVFYRADIVSDVYSGIVVLAQAHGIGSLEANTVMLGWPHKKSRQAAFVRMLQELVAVDKSLLVVNWKNGLHLGDPRNRGRKEIHVWWGGLQQNGGLMLLLAFLLTADQALRSAQVRVMTVVKSDGEERKAKRAIARVLAAARLMATAHVIPRNDRAISDIMRQESERADLAIVGFRLPEGQDEQAADAFFERMNRILEALPTTILVKSARNFESEPVLFE